MVPDETYGFLCKCIQKIPGVTFTKRRRFFWSMENVGAEFIFNSLKFKIETDPWEAGLWVSPADEQKHISEMQELRENIEKNATLIAPAKRNWKKTGVYFVCGFVIGGLAVFQSDNWRLDLTVALVVGILAAIILDYFWNEF